MEVIDLMRQVWAEAEVRKDDITGQTTARPKEYAIFRDGKLFKNKCILLRAFFSPKRSCYYYYHFLKFGFATSLTQSQVTILGL